MEFLVGAGGWAYFQVPDKHPLRAYSEVFSFVEVNYTFYEYPSLSTVKSWRQMVPADFTFAVRCHQDLTHRIGLKPTEEAYAVLEKMKTVCHALRAPFLVLETPRTHSYTLQEISDAQTFFSAISTDGLQLVWEYRAPITPKISSLMRDYGITQAVDLSVQKPPKDAELVYSRVFGKGKHNLYQFTDQELTEIEQNAAAAPRARKVAVSFHGARMYNDAARSQIHIRTGKFLPATGYFGVDSARAVLSEDAAFPLTKAELMADQGWKVIDLSVDKRIHLSDALSRIPDRTYQSVDDVASALEAAQ